MAPPFALLHYRHINPFQLFVLFLLLLDLILACSFFCNMGKEWFWGGSKSRRGAEKDCTCSKATAPGTCGCMTAVCQFFDLHYFQFPLNHSSSFKPTNSILPGDGKTGVEAPRNSLELEEPPPSSSSSTIFRLEENLSIPMGIQIKTRTSGSSSEAISTPSPGGAKTANLVARLMGLDLLPNDRQSHSPSTSSSQSCHETPNFPSKFKSRQHGKLISHRHSVHVDSGTRSLPETPKISSARRSDVDHYHHRLSLQISKENVNDNNNHNAGGGREEVAEFSQFSSLRRKELKQDDEYRSPTHNARQMVKQVKESVSRKAGLDITNTLRNRGGSGTEQAFRERERDRDVLVSQLKADKMKSGSRVLINKAVADHQSISHGKHSAPSCSPRLSRFLEPKPKLPTSPTTGTKVDKSIPHLQRLKCSCEAHQVQVSNVIQPQHIKGLSTSSKSKLQPVQEQEQKQEHYQAQQLINEQRPAKTCKKAATPSDRFSSTFRKPPPTTDIIRNKQEETFVRNSAAMNRANSPDKKSKRTPLSNKLLNITVPKLSPKQVLKDQNSRQSSQLSSSTCQTQTSKKEAPIALCNNNIKEPRRSNNAATTGGDGDDDAEHEYVARILNHKGINRDTHVSFTKWFSPSHPLDPRIFHDLESDIMINPFGHRQLSHHCSRKLGFELVDEILAGILKPYIKMKPWVVAGSNTGRDDHMQGPELIDALCKQIRSYPRADCRVLEDIDGLIEKDLPREMKLQTRIAFEEEGEGVVQEVERDILDTLVHETAAEFGRT